MAMPVAVWGLCAGIRSDGEYGHSMRDNCSTCAPWWRIIPFCPICGQKLWKQGKTKCRRCGRFVIVGERPQEAK